MTRDGWAQPPVAHPLLGVRLLMNSLRSPGLRDPEAAYVGRQEIFGEGVRFAGAARLLQQHRGGRFLPKDPSSAIIIHAYRPPEAPGPRAAGVKENRMRFCFSGVNGLMGETGDEQMSSKEVLARKYKAKARGNTCLF